MSALFAVVSEAGSPYPPTSHYGSACDLGCDGLPMCNTGCDSVFCDKSPTLSGRVKFLYMRRDQTQDSGILRDTNTNQVVLKGNDFDFNFDPGIDASIVGHLGGGVSVEGRFLWIDDWTADVYSRNPAVGNLQLLSNPFSTGGFTDDLSSTYTSRMQTAEINVRQDCECIDVTVYMGFRYAEVDEDLQINSVGAAVPTVMDFDTRNDLFGGQVGLDARVLSIGNLSLDAFAKTGIYANSAQGLARVQVGNNILGSSSDRRVEPAILFETGVEGVVWLTDSIALRGGYQMLIFHGLAVATEQIKSTGNLTPGGTNNVVSQALDTGSHLFAHGVSGGLEFVW